MPVVRYTFSSYNTLYTDIKLFLLLFLIFISFKNFPPIFFAQLRLEICWLSNISIRLGGAAAPPPASYDYGCLCSNSSCCHTNGFQWAFQTNSSSHSNGLLRKANVLFSRSNGIFSCSNGYRTVCKRLFRTVRKSVFPERVTYVDTKYTVIA